MNYFVIWPDGQRFGPVDVATLQQWQIEHRVDNNTILEDARNGNRIRAELVLGQAGSPTTATPFSQQTQTQVPYSGYPRNVSYPQTVAVSDGKNELVMSYVFGVLGIIGCCIPVILPIIGIVLGSTAKSKGQTGAAAAIGLNIVALLISIGMFFFGGLFSLFG